MWARPPDPGVHFVAPRASVGSQVRFLLGCTTILFREGRNKAAARPRRAPTPAGAFIYSRFANVLAVVSRVQSCGASTSNPKSRRRRRRRRRARSLSTPAPACVRAWCVLWCWVTSSGRGASLSNLSSALPLSQLAAARARSAVASSLPVRWNGLPQLQAMRGNRPLPSHYGGGRPRFRGQVRANRTATVLRARACTPPRVGAGQPCTVAWARCWWLASSVLLAPHVWMGSPPPPLPQRGSNPEASRSPTFSKSVASSNRANVLSDLGQRAFPWIFFWLAVIASTRLLEMLEIVGGWSAPASCCASSQARPLVAHAIAHGMPPAALRRFSRPTARRKAGGAGRPPSPLP